MIKKVSIQVNHRLICSGLAVVERDGNEECIFFDVVKGNPLNVIVGSRGKNTTDKEEAAFYAKELLDLFVKHNLPLEIGNHSISA